MVTMKEIFLFDIGGVVVKYNHFRTCNKLAQRCPHSAQEIYNLIYPSHEMQLFETGKLTPKSFFRTISRKLQLDMSFSDFKMAWENIYTLNKPIGALILTLSRTHRVFMLSNNDKLHYKFTYKKYHHILSAAEKVFLSCNLGMLKPDPNIFRKVLSIMKARPETVVYIDDKKENTDAASRLGITSFRYTSITKLRNDFKKHGIALPR